MNDKLMLDLDDILIQINDKSMLYITDRSVRSVLSQ